MKKIIGLLLAATLVLTSLTAFAADEVLDGVVNDRIQGDIMLISAPEDEFVDMIPVIEINGEVIEAAPLSHEDSTLIPLRAVCEKLGMTVTWDGESQTIIIEKAPVYLTLSPYEDGYTLQRTAPIMLGIAPVCISGTTYVPMSFVSEIMQGYIFEENGKIAIFYGEEAEANYITGTVSEIIKDEDGKVSQIVLGEAPEAPAEAVEDSDVPQIDLADTDKRVILNVGDAEFYSNNSELTIDDIAVGDEVKAISKGIATMSIPPQMPVYAVILNK